MISLDDEEFFVEEEPTVNYVKATRSLGRKQSAVRWLPDCAAGSGVVAAGTWDDADNTLALWAVQLEPQEEDMGGMYDAEDVLEPAARLLSSVAHKGCVLGLATAAAGAAAPPLILTAGGDGNLSCFSASASGVGGTGLILQPAWSQAAGGGEALLGVGVSFDSRSVACCGEAGVLSVRDIESGAERARASSDELCLFSVEWVSPHEVLTAGAHVLLWDVRTKPRPTATFIPRFGAAMHAAPQLHSATAHQQQPHRLAAGATNGSLYLWDRRAASSPAVSLAAHAADVWEVRYASTHHGELLSCSSDGTLVARDAAAAATTLVALEFPINSFDVSPVHGGLAAASDAEVLTFIDLRAA